MTDLIRAYALPERYAQEIPMDQIVCDTKVDEDRVEEIRSTCSDASQFKALVVVKHPKKDVYAVLDGHHRFWAAWRSGFPTIRAAVVDDYIGLGFRLTQKGTFQPSPEVTKHIRMPLKRFKVQMEQFLKNPEEVLRQQLNRFKSR
jgi:hypothetical protein